MLHGKDYGVLESPRPSSFAGLMELYEANYIRLRRLCGDLSSLPERSVSRAAGALDLHLTIHERSPYTTTLVLTYHLADPDGIIRPDPNLVVKVYHDARQAEALSRDPGARLYARSIAPRGAAKSLELKWRLNRFLYKWLGYCAHQGHGAWSSDELAVSDRRHPVAASLIE